MDPQLALLMANLGKSSNAFVTRNMYSFYPSYYSKTIKMISRNFFGPKDLTRLYRLFNLRRFFVTYNFFFLNIRK